MLLPFWEGDPPEAWETTVREAPATLTTEGEAGEVGDATPTEGGEVEEEEEEAGAAEAGTELE